MATIYKQIISDGTLDELGNSFKPFNFKDGINFKKDIGKYLKDFTDKQRKIEFDKDKKKVTKWERDLKKKLSTPIPKQYLHKPRPVQRKYPYLNKGYLKDSIEVNFTQTELQGRWIYTLTIESSGKGAEHINLTNKGKNSTRNVKWKNWWDDVTTDGHDNTLIGMNSLMTAIMKRKVNL